MLRALILLAFAPGVAGSQTIYKCTIKGKPTSYQNAPCAANTTNSGIRDYQPESAPTYAQEQAGQVREARAQQESAYLSRMAGTDGRGGAVGHVLPVGGSTCADAKRDRDSWEKQVGLSRSFDTLRQWNDIVQRACK